MCLVLRLAERPGIYCLPPPLHPGRKPSVIDAVKSVLFTSSECASNSEDANLSISAKEKDQLL